MRQPDHVVVIMTDEQRADMCAREGFGVDCTPAVDALAADGCWFDHAYTSAPLCVPSRISLLTGRFPSAHGLRENASIPPRYEADLVDVMSAAGYSTALIGKNHSHLTPDRVDRWVEYGHFGREPHTEAGEYAEFDAWLRELGFANSMTAAPFPVAKQPPSRLVDETIAWLEENRDGRTFTWLSIPEPHVPLQVSEPYFSTYSPATVPPPNTTADALKGRGFVWQHLLAHARRHGEDHPDVLMRARANYVGMIRLIDDQLARLFAHLNTTGMAGRTLVIVLADHGDFAGEYGLLRKGGELAEVLTRIPLVFSGAGVRRGAGRSSAHVSIVDVLPTVCDLVGQPFPRGVQGRSLLGILNGDGVPDHEFASIYVEQGAGGLPYDAEFLNKSGGRQLTEAGEAYTMPGTLDGVTMSGTRRMVRSGRWKLVLNAHGRVELYDLETDPWELGDLADQPEHSAVLARMSSLLSAWVTRAADPLPIPDDGFRRKRHPRNFAWPDS